VYSFRFRFSGAGDFEVGGKFDCGKKVRLAAAFMSAFAGIVFPHYTGEL
jgi:hypothetical protein